MVKLAEGGYNKVLRLVMDNDKVVIARIPNPNAGPAFYTTASEVATLEFLRTVAHVPVPQVLSWSAAADNAVASEYILMEEAEGEQLSDIWNSLKPKSKLSIMDQVVPLETKLLSCSFSHYGNLYFASDNVKGSVPAKITGDISQEVKEEVAHTYAIGPAVHEDYWKNERANMDTDRGPWAKAVDYATSLAHREKAWIERYAVPDVIDEPSTALASQNRPEAHLDLLERYISVVPTLLDVDDSILRPTLWHADLHSSNLFVKDDRITCLIDWQGAWAGPLLSQAQAPEFLVHKGETLLERPDDFDELDDTQRARIQQQITSSKLFQLYLLSTKRDNPRLSQVFELDHGETRCTSVKFAGNTWDDDIIVFREALLNVQVRWKEAGFPGTCPYHFTQEDLDRHLEEGEGWNEIQDFYDKIDGFVARDGWKHNDTYDKAIEFFRTLRKEGLEHLNGTERELLEKRSKWIDQHE